MRDVSQSLLVLRILVHSNPLQSFASLANYLHSPVTHQISHLHIDTKLQS